MTRPLIGITTSLDEKADPPAQTLNHDYVRSIGRAGGCPILLPMTPDSRILSPILERIDGLVIPGGPGISDGLVGTLPDDLPPVSELRRETEHLAFESAQDRGLPILGICYGMQFINERFGGTLYADIQTQLGVGPHSPKRNGGRPIRHRVTVEPGTHLARVLQSRDLPLETNSFHLQAVESPGSDLRVNARSEDGLIEGLETEDGRILAVQFHPEKLPGTIWDRLFGGLIERTHTGGPA